MGIDRGRWPVMVRLGLWGIPGRGVAWSFVVLCLTIAAAGIAYGFVNPLGFVGGLMLFAALWYYLSIRWVDRHSSWS